MEDHGCHEVRERTTVPYPVKSKLPQQNLGTVDVINQLLVVYRRRLFQIF
jgi:hypothetical protein